MKDYLDFSGKTAIVTGGRRGIGRAIAIAFAERGAKVAVISKSQDGAAILEDLAAAGTPGVYLPCDLELPEARQGIVDVAVEKLGGRLDILVNNAGLQFGETIETTTLEHWKTSEELMLNAPFELSQQAIPYMKERGGKIIMISSICSVREGGWTFGYGVMKAGLASMARCMCQTLAKYNINVNVIGPGIIRTDLTTRQGCFDEANYARIIQKYPARRLGEPEEIASVALFLASEMSSFVNGQQLFVDGGFTAQ